MMDLIQAIADTRQRRMDWERACREHGSASVAATIARSCLWSALVNVIIELGTELGDVTAPGISPDELSAPTQEWADLVCRVIRAGYPR